MNNLTVHIKLQGICTNGEYLSLIYLYKNTLFRCVSAGEMLLPPKWFLPPLSFFPSDPTTHNTSHLRRTLGWGFSLSRFTILHLNRDLQYLSILYKITHTPHTPVPQLRGRHTQNELESTQRAQTCTMGACFPHMHCFVFDIDE